MPPVATLCFAALAIASSAVLHGYAIPLVTPPPGSPSCLSLPGAISYPFLPAAVDEMLCAINTGFLVVRTEAAIPLCGVFGGLFVATALISTYESFRPPLSLRTRSASLFALAGQLVTGAVATSAYFALAASAGAGGRGTPSPTHGWSALIAVVLGLVVPTAFMYSSYHALSAWQPFPAYILALNVVLPPILARLRIRASPVVPIAAVATAASMYAQRTVLASPVPLADIFLPTYDGSVASGLHLIFAVDFVGTLIATVGWVAYTVRPNSALGVVVFVAALVMLSVLLGPGAAVVLIWAFGEQTRVHEKGE